VKRVHVLATELWTESVNVREVSSADESKVVSECREIMGRCGFRYGAANGAFGRNLCRAPRIAPSIRAASTYFCIHELQNVRQNIWSD